jgi:hypothetical protein
MQEIRKAYRDLAKKYHPDINADAGAAAMTAKINAAYDLLITPEKRSAYDNRFAFVYDDSDVDLVEENFIEEYDEAHKNESAETRDKERKRATREAITYGIVRMIYYPIALFSLLVILDYYLPVHTELDYPLLGYQRISNGKYSDVSSFMKTTQHEFEVPNTVHVDYDYDAVEKKLLCMEFTPIFNTIKRVGVDHGEFALMYKAPGTIYLPWFMPVPYILLFASLFFIRKKEYNRLLYSFCFIPLAIALAFFTLMLLS